MLEIIFFLFLFYLCVLVVNSDIQGSSLIIDTLERNINLSSRIITVTQAVTIRNPSPRDVSHFYAALPKDLSPHIGHIYVVWEKNALTVEPVSNWEKKLDSILLFNDKQKDTKTDIYTIPIRIQQNSTINYQLIYLLGRYQKPFPKSIGYHDSHLVIVKDRTRVVSPYVVLSQRTKVTFPSKIIENLVGLTLINPMVATTPTFTNIDAFTLGPKDLEAHYEFQEHLGFFSSVNRHIQVSHWGQISIRERYEFENDAAELNEEYDRWKLSSIMKTIVGRRRPIGHPYPKHRFCFQLDAKLPKNAYAIEFYDKIGNVSTSNARRNVDFMNLEIEPRYPVLGGWKADWYIEYKLAVSSALRTSQIKPSNNIIHQELIIPLGPGFKTMFTETLNASVTLPNGAYNIKVTTPRALQTPIKFRKEWGWLDIVKPRDVITINTQGYTLNTFRLLNHNIKIEYDYRNSYWSNFRKPIGCCLVALLPFLLYMITQRIDFRIFSSILDSTILEKEFAAFYSVQLLLQQINKINTHYWEKVCAAKTNCDIAQAKIEWKRSTMPLLLEFSKIVNIARDSLHVQEEYKRYVNTAHNVTIQTTSVVETLLNDANIEGWKLPRELEAKWSKCQRHIRALVADNVIKQLDGNLEKIKMN